MTTVIPSRARCDDDEVAVSIYRVGVVVLVAVVVMIEVVVMVMVVVVTL